jgi:hypothetical protein
MFSPSPVWARGGQAPLRAQAFSSGGGTIWPGVDHPPVFRWLCFSFPAAFCMVE